MTRADKIKNIELSLQVRLNQSPATPQEFSYDPQYSGLNGPHINIVTPQYEGTAYVEFEGSMVSFETYGYTHRFTDIPRFLEFFEQSLTTPLHAIFQLAKSLGGKTLGNTIVLRKGEQSYYITEVPNGFMLFAGSEKMLMSSADIIGLIGG